MAFGVKTNEGAVRGVHGPGERPGTRAVAKHVRMSAWKARQVLDAIRGKDIVEADAILQFTEREAAGIIRKVLASAVANAANNDGIDPEILYVSACFADEGTTVKRYRPRARGRATRIRKRTCHITVIVSPYAADELERRRVREEARVASGGGARRARTASEARAARVARSRQKEAVEATEDEVDEAPVDEVETDEIETEVEETDAEETDDVEAEAQTTEDEEEDGQ